MTELPKATRTKAAFPLAVMAIVAMMVVPLPSIILDLLLSINIAAAVLVLLSAMNAKKVLDLASFPSILLLATLFRLGLNVSTTRQILGSGQAGSVITSFGQSVVGGSLVVGLVVFFILVIIQFVVITNGSSRVSEVAARFTLDAMPGKQMAIDADLNAGLLTESQARTRRAEIAREADFFGAMDGASKFVKGDAIAGLIITAVNLLGGLAIGMSSMGLSAGEAANRFSMLTIGDGLVSQIPALLISIAAGIIVTRSSAAEDDLGGAITSEFAAQQRSFQLAGVALAVLGALPGLPFIPFVAVGGLLVMVSIRLKASQVVNSDEDAVETEPEVDPDDPSVLIRSMQVDPLTLEIAHDLIDLVDEPSGGDLLLRIRGLRRKIALEKGFIAPPVRTRDNAGLKFGTYRILVHGVEAASGFAPHGKVLVIDDNLDRWPGEQVIEPVFGLPAKWVTEATRESATAAGATVVDRSAVITTHLGEIIAQQAPDLFDRQQLKELVAAIGDTHPAVVEDLGTSDVPMPVLQWVLRDLLSSGASICDSARIIEVVAASYAIDKNPENVAEEVRVAIGPSITANHAVDGVLSVISLDPMLEREIAAALTGVNGSDALDAESLQRVVSDICELNQRAQNTGVNPVVLCAPQVRRALSSVLSQITAAPPVMSFKEAASAASLSTVGTVQLPARAIEGNQ